MYVSVCRLTYNWRINGYLLLSCRIHAPIFDSAVIFAATGILFRSGTDLSCLGGAVVVRRTCDRKVAGSSRSTQPSIPPG